MHSNNPFQSAIPSRTRKLPIGPLLAACVLLPVGCAEESEPAARSATEPAAWVLAEAPADARSIVDVKAQAKEGDLVVIEGIIGGSRQPITEGSAVFLIVDTGLYNRCTEGDDHCKTPWDYCCAPGESLAESTATVQVVSASGGAVSGDLASQGFSPLDSVVVVGTVGPRPDARVLTIRATGVHRAGG